MKIWIIAGAILLALAIVLGAFGAHIIKSKVSPEDLAIFETGVRYHAYHALGLILIGLIGFHVHQNVIVIPAMMITAGIYYSNWRSILYCRVGFSCCQSDPQLICI